MKCSIPHCSSELHCKGLCKKHYMKLKRHGDPLYGRFHNRKRGQGTVTKEGYIEFKIGERSVLAHIVIAEKALGKKLPTNSIVHHVDCNKQNNSNSNLVICPNDAYHQLLHRRMRSLEATGNPNMVKCQYCKEWDSPENILIGKRVKYHKICKNLYEQIRTNHG